MFPIDIPSPPDYDASMATMREGGDNMAYTTTAVEACAKCGGIVKVTYYPEQGDGSRRCSWCHWWEEFDQYGFVWNSGYDR